METKKHPAVGYSDPRPRKQEPYSPFLDEEFLAHEAEQRETQRAWTLPWLLRPESPFLHTFDLAESKMQDETKISELRDYVSGGNDEKVDEELKTLAEFMAVEEEPESSEYDEFYGEACDESAAVFDEEDLKEEVGVQIPAALLTYGRKDLETEENEEHANDLAPIELQTRAPATSCEPSRFRKGKLNVVVWRGRTTPGKRRIPKGLKLGILARGRIRLPTSSVKWLLDVHKETSWVKRLKVDLATVHPEADVTAELFINQRSDLSQAQLGKALDQYVRLRHERHLKGCRFFVALFDWATMKPAFESRLGISLDRLYRRPHVPVPPKIARQNQFVLFVYASFPNSIARHIKPKVPELPPVITTRMPPIMGETTRTFYRLRKGPSTKDDPLGEMTGESVPVTVLDKQKDGDRVWYKAKLLRRMKVKRGNSSVTLPAGTAYWVVEGGLFRAADWTLFRNQLIALEQAHSGLSLNDRITKLRQMSHSKQTAFDDVIGTAHGTEYLEDITFHGFEWQLFKDYQAVVSPDGRWVDIHHILVGLDVLRRPERAHLQLGINIGTNWAATTWSGDIGAAAADATLKIDEWSKQNKSASAEEIVKHYWQTRAPDKDLLADIDAWAIHALRSPKLKTIDHLLVTYYENTRPGGARPLTTGREEAIEFFLVHYGFTYDFENHNYPDTLRNQRTPRMRIQSEISRFSHIWMLLRKTNLFAAKPEKQRARFVPDMTREFMYWLERTALENGAQTP